MTGVGLRWRARGLTHPPHAEAPAAEDSVRPDALLRTLLTCTPRRRWMPAQAMQRTTPRFRLAQSGSAAPQSQQRALPATRRSASRGPPAALPPPLPGRAPGAGATAAGPAAGLAAAAKRAARPAPTAGGGAATWAASRMAGRLEGGEPRADPGCSLSAVSEVRADRLAPRGPDPSGASARDSSRTSLLMLHKGSGGICECVCESLRQHWRPS